MRYEISIAVALVYFASTRLVVVSTEKCMLTQKEQLIYLSSMGPFHMPCNVLCE